MFQNNAQKHAEPLRDNLRRTMQARACPPQKLLALYDGTQLPAVLARLVKSPKCFILRKVNYS